MNLVSTFYQIFKFFFVIGIIILRIQFSLLDATQMRKDRMMLASLTVSKSRTI
jgi:hypothetical protein